MSDERTAESLRLFDLIVQQAKDTQRRDDIAKIEALIRCDPTDDAGMKAGLTWAVSMLRNGDPETAPVWPDTSRCDFDCIEARHTFGAGRCYWHAPNVPRPDTDDDEPPVSHHPACVKYGDDSQCTACNV